VKNKFIYLYLAWIVAAFSTAGSLFLSHFMNLPPCSLCWYQRICMFPLVAILWVGVSSEDLKAHLYALPLILVGTVLAVYHNLLYYKWISEALIPCSSGVSCTERQLDLLGFISIPLMSLVSFVLLLFLNLAHLKSQRGSA
jgi:disulfide bond formation protein DsbB